MWLTVAAEGVKAMDALEEYFGPGDPRNEYDRVVIRDALNGLEGYAYIWSGGRGYPVIASGDWKLENIR
jgi:gamma-glutamylcyclotransferase (GGCT)/AIG2-like uncharacterized protein YtfP